MLIGTLVLTAAPVQAEQQVAVGQVLAPAFNVTLVGLDRADEIAPPQAQPIIDVGRDSVMLIRDLADATILGAKDGDIGTHAGSPNQVGVVTPHIVVIDGVRVPGYTITIPERQVPVSVPGVDRTVYVPGFTIPERSVTVPDRDVVVRVPPVYVPGVTYTTPPVGVTTPPVATPGVPVGTPPLDVAPVPVGVDVTGMNLHLQSLRGEFFFGDQGSVPYETPAVQAGESNLPGSVPRGVSYTVPGATVPGQDITTVPAREWVPGMTRHVADSREISVDGTEVYPGMYVTTFTVHGGTVTTPGHSQPPSQHDVHVPGMHVITVTVPGQSATTDEIFLDDGTFVLPPVEVIFNGLTALDDFGYFGYGRQDDSSMYPYLCGPLFGCLSSDGFLRTFVNLADAGLDFAAGTVDGSIVYVMPGPTADMLTIRVPQLPPIYVTQIGVSIVG